jgi:sterol desaturase/sphingolipid hydroxylase (fatty acid hydroxylase superfamily)
MGLLETTDEWKEAFMEWDGINDRPSPKNRKRDRGFQVLKNPLMEKYIGTSHWLMPGVWFIPTAIACMYASVNVAGVTLAMSFVLFGFGVLGWTLVEYLLHRWLFHSKPVSNLKIREIQFMMHGYHHEFPNDPGRLVAPPALSWPIAATLVAIYSLLFGANWWALFAGTVTGYLGYDWMHFYTHHAVPRSSFGKFMRRFHLEHHFACANYQFGLSSPLWDMLFASFWSKSKAREKESKSPAVAK